MYLVPELLMKLFADEEYSFLFRRRGDVNMSFRNAVENANNEYSQRNGMLKTQVKNGHVYWITSGNSYIEGHQTLSSVACILNMKGFFYESHLFPEH